MINPETCRKHVSLDGRGYGEHKWGFFCARLKDHKGEHDPYPEISRQGIGPSDELISIQGKIKKLHDKLAFLRAAENEAKENHTDNLSRMVGGWW